jgi:hypothetical protein
VYEGGFQFKKHYFGPKPGELRETTERMENAEYKVAMPARDWLSWAILRREWDGLGKRSKAETLKAERDHGTTSPQPRSPWCGKTPHTPRRVGMVGRPDRGLQRVAGGISFLYVEALPARGAR